MALLKGVPCWKMNKGPGFNLWVMREVAQERQYWADCIERPTNIELGACTKGVRFSTFTSSSVA